MLLLNDMVRELVSKIVQRLRSDLGLKPAFQAALSGTAKAVP
jgi:hypothetical protein